MNLLNIKIREPTYHDYPIGKYIGYITMVWQIIHIHKLYQQT